MSRPLFRLAAASCLAALALASGSARASYDAPDMPKWEYPELEIKPTDVGEEPQEPKPGEDDIVTLTDAAPQVLAYQTTGGGVSTMPVRNGDVWTWTYNGVRYTCGRATPTGTPTPAEHAPEPSSLALLAAGSAALLLARRRRRAG